MSTAKVLVFIRCPCCGLWRYLGKFEAFSIWDALENGFDIPLEVDYRAGGGRARGWKTRVRRKRLPIILKDAYIQFIKEAKKETETCRFGFRIDRIKH